MKVEKIYPLDQESLNLFALKGRDARSHVSQTGNGNGAEVRRIIQIIRDFSKKPFEELKIIDLACGEGVYSIEAALHGATVNALDARTDRMNEGIKAGKRLGLKKLYYKQDDVRNVKFDTYGNVDVVMFLGMLYHLDKKDIFQVLKNLFEMCNQFIVIDTHISMTSEVETEYNGKVYEGKDYREHGNNDSQEVRNSRLLSSIDNTLSFWFTKESLFRLLNDIGFTTVCECSIPIVPFKSENRVTIIAFKGEPVKISTYPWVNNKSEIELKKIIKESQKQTKAKTKYKPKQIAKSIINKMFHILGFRISRI